MEAQKKLATVVSYCSNERNFARPLLTNALLFSDAVVLSVGERLYNGDPEDEAHLAKLAAEFPAVHVVRYSVPPGAPPIPLHNAARKAGVVEAARLLSVDSWVLFLDGDEVPDGPRMSEWWTAVGPSLDIGTAIKVLNYWLFLDPRLVAQQHEDSAVLMHCSRLTNECLSHPRERDGLIWGWPETAGLSAGGSGGTGTGNGVVRRVGGLDGAPLIWHFSWVRADRAALKRKTEAWGHKDDKKWAELIDLACDGIEKDGVMPERDFVHGYPLRALPGPAFGWDANPL